jgi:Ni/Fe-hydrogenase subunit HybB-like protein
MESMRPTEEFRQRLEQRVLAPLTHTGKGFWLLVGGLSIVVAWGLYAYFFQLRDGLIVTGLGDRPVWGLYITLFVFFIGVSHAGTLISAILRVTKAGWRTPITRMAEFITVVALMIGAVFPLLDIGRPDRVFNLIQSGRWQSPIIWDILAITTYLTGSLIYLYLPMIPDLAVCRDRLRNRISSSKHRLYRIGSLGWQGSWLQRKHLESGIGLMMIIIIPVAVSVHTVVSWMFAMTLREPWNTAMFGIYFVAGAIFSGIAAIVVLMAILRKVYGLEEYITPRHFINLGYMLAAFVLIMLYFNVSEYLTYGYNMAGEKPFHFEQIFSGALAPYYWTYLLAGILLPGLLILLPFTRNIAGIVVASVLVNIGMWLERYFIVVGGLRIPLMPYEPVNYVPTWVEWSIMAGAFAAFALIIVIFAKLFPVIAIWEVAEHHEEEAAQAPQPAAPAFVGASSFPLPRIPEPVSSIQHRFQRGDGDSNESEGE